mmetsp:Transcript_3691/g.14506  ORF Transcript_3691/g.14506 Transcript_3691/m.14506 type:complete len:592 (-) Transcript_3691:114-1889(-)
MSSFLQNVAGTISNVLSPQDPRYEGQLGSRRRVQRDPRIWKNRIASELQRLEASDALPQGFSIVEKAVDEEKGICQVGFRFVYNAGGGAELVTSEIIADLSRSLDFPFEAPNVRVLTGTQLFPTSVISGDGVLHIVDWMPSKNIAELLVYVRELVSEAQTAPWHKQASQALTRKGQMAIAAIRRHNLKRGGFSEGQNLSAMDIAEFGRLFTCTPPEEAESSDFSAVPPGSIRYMGVTIEQVVLLDANSDEKVDLIAAASGSDTGIEFTVAVVRPLRELARLRLRNKSDLTLQFRDGRDLKVSAEEAKTLVTALKEAMMRRGVKNKQTALQKHEQNTRHHRMRSVASEFLISIQTAEQQLVHHPSLEAIEAVMDLFRQALEFFGQRDGDEEQITAVLEHKNRFLQRSDVQMILCAGTADEGPKPSALTIAKSKDDEGEEDDGTIAADDDLEESAQESGGVRTIVGGYAELSISAAGQVLKSPEAVYDSDDDDLEREEGLVGLRSDSTDELGPGLKELRDMIGKVDVEGDMAGSKDIDGDDFLSFMSALESNAPSKTASQAGGNSAESNETTDDLDIDAVFAELDQLTSNTET